MRPTTADEVGRWRIVVLASLPLWVVSFTVLLWASTTSRVIAPWQLTWQGAVDVLTAFAVCVLGILVYYKANPLVSPATQRLSYAIATVAPAVLLVALWLFADRLRFDILLPGLAWRTYFVLTTLPGALALWRRGPKSQEAKAAVNQSSNGGRAIASYFDRRGVSLGF